MTEKIYIKIHFKDNLHDFDKAKGICTKAFSNYKDNNFTVISVKLLNNKLGVMIEPNKELTYRNIKMAASLINKNIIGNKIEDIERKRRENWQRGVKTINYI